MSDSVSQQSMYDDNEELFQLEPRNKLDDKRIKRTIPLPTPGKLRERYPLSAHQIDFVAQKRQEIDDIVLGRDPKGRRLVIVGPCSVHDPVAALEYAQLLKVEADRFAEELCIIMRVYFEKPRTSVGWKGLINDPNLDGSTDVASGLIAARQLLLQIADLGSGSGNRVLGCSHSPVVVRCHFVGLYRCENYRESTASADGLGAFDACWLQKPNQR